MVAILTQDFHWKFTAHCLAIVSIRCLVTDHVLSPWQCGHVVVIITGDEEVVSRDLFKDWWIPGHEGQRLAGVERHVRRAEYDNRCYLIWLQE